MEGINSTNDQAVRFANFFTNLTACISYFSEEKPDFTPCIFGNW